MSILTLSNREVVFDKTFTNKYRRLIMAFSFIKSNRIKVKYVVKQYPSGYLVKQRAVKPEDLDVLKNDPDISHLEILN